MKNAGRKNTESRAPWGITAGALALIGTAACALVGMQPGSRGNAVSGAAAQKSAPATRREAMGAYAKLPIAFEQNEGQTDARVKFVAHGTEYALFLTDGGAVLSLEARPNPGNGTIGPHAQRPELARAAKTRGATLRLNWAGSNKDAHVEGLDLQPGRTNYFIGNNPSKWHTNVPRYARVKYAEIYPGVDMVFYGQGSEIESDYILAPGASADRIRLGIEGERGLNFDAQGNLILSTNEGNVVLEKPKAYQEIEGIRRGVEASYVRRRGHLVGVRLGAYDAKKPLVIDPALSYATFLGGSNQSLGQELPNGIAVDSSGDAYITGYTKATDYPTTTGAYQTTNNASGLYAFVTKLNATGTALVYSTFLEGSNTGEGEGIAVDASGDAYVAGATSSTDFPTLNGYQSVAVAGGAFLAELNPSGSGLIYSTYLAGTGGGDGANAVALGANGNAYLAGVTNSTDFPITPGLAYQSTNNSTGGTGFVAEINSGLPGTPSLLYSSYVGGGTQDSILGLAVDSSGNAYVTGWTHSPDYPVTPSAYQPNFLNTDGMGTFSEVSTTSANLNYSTYVGGSSNGFGSSFDNGYDVAIAPSGIAYVVGVTYAKNFPLVNAISTTSNAPNAKAFIAGYNTTKSGTASLVYSTYFGGSLSDLGFDIKVDSLGNIYVTGTTASSDFPTVIGAPQPNLAGAQNAFLSELNSTGSTLLFSTFLGGGSDAAYTLALDQASPPNAYIAGIASEASFPVTAGAYQTTLKGPTNNFVAKLSPGAAQGVFVAPTTLNFGNQGINSTSASQTVTLTNNASTTLSNIAITFTGANPGDFGETNTCGATSTTNGSLAAFTTCQISVAFTPSATGAESATLNIADSDASSPQLVTLSGTGTAVSLSPSTLNFGNQTENTASAPQTVTLTNNGTTALAINSITTTGANAGDFSQTNTCGASVAAGGNCTISVTFTPTTQSAESATLQVSDSDPSSPQTVALTGTGTKPVSGVGLSPSSLNFGNQSQGTASPAQTVTLTNNGTSALTINSITTTGANAGDFGETNTCGASVAAGGNCTISVTFTPSTQAAESANLSIADSDPSSPQVVPLSGTGTAPVTSFSITLSPTAGTITAGQTIPVTATVTSENSFNAAVTLSVSGCPGDASCVAAPNPVTPPVNGSVTSTITITTDLAAETVPGGHGPFGAHPGMWMWGMLGLGMALTGYWAARRRSVKRLACGFAMVLLIGLASCSGTPHTPKGTYQVQIKGTSGTQTFPATFTLTVQ
jgi:hypothetical protein